MAPLKTEAATKRTKSTKNNLRYTEPSAKGQQITQKHKHIRNQNPMKKIRRKKLFDASLQITLTIFSIITFTEISKNPIHANEYYKYGLKQGFSAKVAATLSYCRLEAGQGSDWTNHYNQLLGVKESTAKKWSSIPKHLRDKSITSLIKSTLGSCEAYLEKDEQQGTEWFIKNAIDPYVEGRCKAKRAC